MGKTISIFGYISKTKVGMNQHYRGGKNAPNKREKVYLAQRCCKGLMGAVEAGSELGADASGQFSSTETFYGVLGHFPLPLWRDGGRVHECYPVDDLGATQKSKNFPSEDTVCFF